MHILNTHPLGALNADKSQPQLQQTQQVYYLISLCYTAITFLFFLLYYYFYSDCVKGYYKRAKAHAAVWNEKEARRDFNTVAQLDVTLASLVHRELKALSESLKEKYWEEKEKYWNMLDKKEPERDEVEEKEEEGEGNESVSKDGECRSAGEVGGNEDGDANDAPAEGAGNKAEASEVKCSASERTKGKDWQQMLRLVMLLQNEGSFLIKEKRFQEACAKFKEAVEYVDFLQNTVGGNDYTVNPHKLRCVSGTKTCKTKPFVVMMSVQMSISIHPVEN